MKLDRFIQMFLPHDNLFYNYFSKATKNLVETSELLMKIPNSSENERQQLVIQIQDKEHLGDALTHDIFSELNKSFITPIDREDIHILTSAIDDVLDNINEVATRFSLYKLKECPPEAKKLIEIVHHSISELHRGVELIKNLNQPDQLRIVLKKINEYENEADHVFEIAVADLFENEKDPIKIIKIKEIYVGLETATDKCEDAANVLESILIKHA
ncbi:MAG: DUF47 domain-containing protein [Chlorobiaceae bacterium]|nr:DUF47 domain-containing protein [Chlorobiaceae bacterium]